MTRRMTIRLFLVTLGALALAGTGCRDKTAESSRQFGFDAFVPIYNRHIETWLKEQQEETNRELARVEEELAAAEGPLAERLKSRIESLRRIRRNGASGVPSGTS
jgi:flagellar motility protein MotE (MotC chaperone)